MPESAAYSRRSFGKTAKPTSLSSPIDGGATTISLVDASTWPDGSGGPFMVTFDLGLSTEERVECPTRVGNLLQSCVRGADGTTPQSHGMIVNGAEHTSTGRDYDEANAHIALVALDHHTQYARTDGSRTITGGMTISRAAPGSSVNVTKEAASLQTGSVFIGRSAAGQPQSLVFGTGTTYSVDIGRAASTDDLSFDKWDGATLSSMAKLTTADTSGQTALYLRFNDGSSNRFERVQVGAADSGGTGKRAFVVNN